jgi:hypothetical protein
MYIPRIWDTSIDTDNTIYIIYTTTPQQLTKKKKKTPTSGPTTAFGIPKSSEFHPAYGDYYFPQFLQPLGL